MKKLKKTNFLEGAFIATLCIIITKIMGVLYVIPFYKIIGEQAGTLYGYAYNIYNVFLTISTAGFPLAISKLTSEYNTLNEVDKKARMHKIATTLIVGFSVLSFLICFIFAPQISHLILGELQGGNTREDVTFVIRLISFALLIIPTLSIERGYLQGHRYILEPSISQVIEQLVRIIIIIVGSYLCTYTFKLSARYSVGISVLAAAISGVVAFIYLSRITKRNRHQIGLNKTSVTTKKEDKEILKKLIMYSITFIIVNLANTLYASTDMILVIRTLPNLGFSAGETEFISSVFTTWGIKFNTIISSISTGLIISLIPNIVKDYTEKNMPAVNNNFNKCLKIIMLIIAPLAIYMSCMSTSVWSVFYGYNTIGAKIIKYTIIVTIFDCMYMVINSLLQSLNKSKIIYLSVLLGLATNLILDIPLMYLFNYLGIVAYYGAITATLIGFLISNIISMIHLKNTMNLNYQDTLKAVPRFLISIIILILVLRTFNIILPTDSQNRLIQLINLAISGIVGASIYLAINLKNIKSIMPDKLIKKLHLEKI